MIPNIFHTHISFIFYRRSIILTGEKLAE